MFAPVNSNHGAVKADLLNAECTRHWMQLSCKITIKYYTSTCGSVNQNMGCCSFDACASPCRGAARHHNVLLQLSFACRTSSCATHLQWPSLWGMSVICTIFYIHPKPHGHSNWYGLCSFAAGFWLQGLVNSRLIIMCLQHRKQWGFQSTPSLLTGLRSFEMSSTPPALCSASCSTLTCSLFFLRPSSSLLRA